MPTYTERFNGSLDLDWRIVRGSEPVVVNSDGTGSIDAAFNANSLVTTGGAGSADMYAECDVTESFDSTDRTFFLMVRGQDNYSITYYAISCNEQLGNIRLLRYVNGSSTEIAQEPFSYSNPPYRLRLEAQGDTLRVRSGGALVLQTTDSGQNAISSGDRGGIGVFNGRREIRFDNFTFGPFTIPIEVDGARSVTRATAPLVRAALITDDARTGTRTTTVLLDQASPLSLDPARASTRASMPLTGHTYRLTVQHARAATRVADRPLLISGTTVHPARAATRATGPLLTAPLILHIDPVHAGTRAELVTPGQRSPLAGVAGLRVTTTTPRPGLAQAHALGVPGLRATTAATDVAIGQFVAMELRSARAASRAELVLVELLPGIAVRNPTGLRASPDGPATVSVAVHGAVALPPAHGAVREIH